MKINKYLVLFGFVIIFGLIAGYVSLNLGKNQSSQDVSIDSTADRYGNNNQGMGQGQEKQGELNRGNCLSDDCLLVDNLEYPVGELSSDAKKALNDAINDEYKALSTYEAVIEKFGNVRPFSMIKGAEEQHISSLKAIYDKYGIEIPVNDWPREVIAPDTLTEACQIGVEAEIANADLYKKELLPAVQGYEDIVSVFTNLMNASEQKHLPAFEKCN